MLKRFLPLTLSVCLGAAAAPAALAQAPITEQEAHGIAVDAYVYFYPLLSMEMTRRQFSNIGPDKELGKGPMNMAIGRTFQESLQKALRGLETGLTGLDEIEIEGLGRGDDKNAIRAALGTPTPNRILQVAQAMRLGWSDDEIYNSCKIDPCRAPRISG